MRLKILLPLTVAFLVALPIQAHTFNHENRHEACEADLPPEHAIDDGHAHFHHLDDVGAHFHGGVFHEAGHTHEAHHHDPCKQTGMDRPEWPDAGPLTKVFQEDAIINVTDPLNSLVITDFDAFLLEVPDLVAANNLILVGDAMLDAYAAAGGMSGSGTRDDPYILEGHFLRNALLIKDTSKCVVIRDNVVHSRAVIGPIFSSDQIIDLREQVATLEEQTSETQTALDEAYAAADEALISQLEVQLDEEEQALDETEEKLVAGSFEYAGTVADTTQQLATEVLRAVQEELPWRAGRMILDWNGQCIHAYNNIVEDLRVNQNNVRTGFATGGLLEDNQFFHIGQIRHYDGEFRDNVVGYKEHLRSFLPAEDFPHVPSFRTMNTDGFNQGWFHDNLFYGSVDLDFHGHHHGAGFFAPESHYHGSAHDVAYMVGPDGECLAKHDHGHHHGHQDPLLDLTILDAKMEECLPHHNHQLRWTSAVFEDNVIIDPLGYGLRYEDRNHQGDDRYANSEDMRELDAPHFHRSDIRIADNLVLGSVWVDIFNSPSVEVWSDDFSEVRRDIGGALIDALLHLGAEPIPSHPQRNDGWFDVSGNTALTYDKHHNTPGFHYGWAAFQLNHIWEGDVDFVDNDAYFVPYTLTTQADTETFLQELLSIRDLPAPLAAAQVDSWGEHRSDGPMSFAFVFHYLEDATVDVCGNAARGFDVDVFAYNQVYDDSTVDICPQNDLPGESYVRYTPLPQDREPGLTAPLRGFTDDTSFEPLMEHVYTPTEQREDQAYAQQDWLEAWSDAQLANVQRNVDMQLANVDRWATQQQAWADRTADNQQAWADRTIAHWSTWGEQKVAQNMFWADYQAAKHMAWADFQVARYMSEADYRAAHTMGYVEWAELMAQKYTYSLPLAA